MLIINKLSSLILYILTFIFLVTYVYLFYKSVSPQWIGILKNWFFTMDSWRSTAYRPCFSNSVYMNHWGSCSKSDSELVSLRCDLKCCISTSSQVIWILLIGETHWIAKLYKSEKLIILEHFETLWKYLESVRGQNQPKNQKGSRRSRTVWGASQPLTCERILSLAPLKIWIIVWKQFSLLCKELMLWKWPMNSWS